MIREATTKDIPTLIDFQQKMAWETEKITLDPNVLLQGANKLFEDETRGKYYVLEENGVVMGSLMTTYEWSEWRNGTVLWIQSVYVLESQRGKGIYKKMYEHIREMVNKSKELIGIRLYVDKTNKSAQQVYSKLGMNGEHYQVFEWMK
ncbi:MAG: GNAT family N-acetyltransferase [Bacteroidia bacterium]|nr:GNAT family N-acetyltransferase [Bacteroidia bacterium]